MRLLTLVPRNIGFSVAEAYDVVNDKLKEATKQDKFIINFSQFYMMLLRVTQIVYAELFDKDATLAFNKLLQVRIYVMFLVLFMNRLALLFFFFCVLSAHCTLPIT